MEIYMGRKFTNEHSSTAFSDYNNDQSGDFTTPSRQLWISCATEDTKSAEELIRQLIANLRCSSIDDQKQAAMEIRLLAKNKRENRIKIARSGAVGPLISLISSTDLQLQEYGVTTILNLSLCDENKELMADCGAIKLLVTALWTGTATSKENAACSLLRLSQIKHNKIAIGRSGAIILLVKLLESGSYRGNKDVSTALYSICTTKENKLRAVRAGIMKPLIELMAVYRESDFESMSLTSENLSLTSKNRARINFNGGQRVDLWCLRDLEGEEEEQRGKW